MNTLYYGDNLDILRRYVDDETVDLIYLDPPFNSKANYNMLFEEHDGSRSAAQFQAFEDTWHWDQSAAAALEGQLAVVVFLNGERSAVRGDDEAPLLKKFADQRP